MFSTSAAAMRAALCASATMAVMGCASTPDPVIGMAATQPRADLGQAGYSQSRSQTYALRPADRISVNVFREPDFSLETVRIGVAGNVSIPMLGAIPAAGMTAAEFEQNVAARLAAVGLREPMVSVNIVEYASHLVTVEGAVNDPGVYNFEPGARLSSAVALGGGTTNVAKLDQVAVFRESPEGIMIAKFDYAQVRQGTMLDPLLQPGDRVVVGIDGLSAFYQDVLRALPAFAFFINAAR
ncbi:MAG: polysaccharide biosynthesis/export family protein [Erythrobacter sp.]|nr:polysaccharide biosynthesis/export family protein [Erythrobacter sp.]